MSGVDSINEASVRIRLHSVSLWLKILVYNQLLTNFDQLINFVGRRYFNQLLACRVLSTSSFGPRFEVELSLTGLQLVFN